MTAMRRRKSDFDALLPPAAASEVVAPRRRGWRRLPLRAAQLGCRAIVALTMSVSLLMLLLLWTLTRLLEVAPEAE